MIRRPPRSTRTDTLFPYTTLCRSVLGGLYTRHSGWRRKKAESRSPGARIPASLTIRRRPLLSRCRSEEHTSELQSLMRISYAVFCLKKKKKQNTNNTLYTVQSTHNNTPKQSPYYILINRTHE